MQVHRSNNVEGNASCDLGSRLNKIFLVNSFPLKLLDIAASNFAGLRSYDVEDTGQRSSEIMYFLVNASPPKPLDVATSNFADDWVRSKAGICNGVPSTEV